MTCHASRTIAVLVVTCLALGSTACGGAVYQPSQSATFDVDAAKEIDDDDVKKAFEARPQLASTVSVAFYSFDPARAVEIEGMLHTVQGSFACSPPGRTRTCCSSSTTATATARPTAGPR